MSGMVLSLSTAGMYSYPHSYWWETVFEEDKRRAAFLWSSSFHDGVQTRSAGMVFLVPSFIIDERRGGLSDAFCGSSVGVYGSRIS